MTDLTDMNYESSGFVLGVGTTECCVNFIAHAVLC
jgi:hypothetical protein